MTRRIVISESPEFSPPGQRLLSDQGFVCDIFTGSLTDLPAALSDADGAIVRFGLRWTADLLAAVPSLKFLAVAATGTDHIDRVAADTLGVAIISLAGNPGLKEITATPEHTFGLMLALLRHTPAAHLSVLSGQWNRDAYFGRQLRGMTVGIVGLGRTGRAFAHMLSGFGVRVVYVDPYVEADAWHRCADLSELAGMSDVVAIHAVYNDETTGLLGNDFFTTLKPGAYVVNTARGGILDEEALITALEAGRVAGAALDVLQNEPAKGESLRSPLVDYARSHPNIILTPHIAGATRESIEQAELLLAKEICRHCGEGGVSH